MFKSIKHIKADATNKHWFLIEDDTVKYSILQIVNIDELSNYTNGACYPGSYNSFLAVYKYYQNTPETLTKNLVSYYKSCHKKYCNVVYKYTNSCGLPNILHQKLSYPEQDFHWLHFDYPNIAHPKYLSCLMRKLKKELNE